MPGRAGVNSGASEWNRGPVIFVYVVFAKLTWNLERCAMAENTAVTIDYTEHETMEIGYYSCPRCGKRCIEIMFEFCPQCGVEINWVESK